ncbi:hypothetical protein L2E82_45057 [Cichorium intybus]|uniref:Uncharacterized protein n=1 Tax=Cichorium intybus TaxID=13427 RepID=A0ACB8ZRV0_CICIN|nr:hypothetical protein L2E82_45057 [Cichorium intybus]
MTIRILRSISSDNLSRLPRVTPVAYAIPPHEDCKAMENGNWVSSLIQFTSEFDVQEMSSTYHLHILDLCNFRDDDPSIYWNICQFMDKEKECYNEATSAKILEASNRRSSSRLQIKKKLSTCSQDIYKSHKNTSKYTKSSKDEKNPISEIKIKDEKNVIFLTGPASMKSSTIVPSFKYHIGAKDGIRLIVDLNLKRSDWLKNMEKTICVCQNHLKHEFGSFRKEVECLGGNDRKDETTLSDASMNSYVQNKFSIKSMSKEIGKTLPSKHHWSKFDRSSEYLENVSEKDSLCSRTGEMMNSPQGMEVSGENGHKRKKRYDKNGQSHERILRSTKFFGGQILESGGLIIRRSSRLHSKAGGKSRMEGAQVF